jgi:NAD(P)-dependent dehydrogenase (short-subunit alcohol dehydrogenase family)
MSLKKSVLITGCSAGGIGSALALTFHARGFQVFATARSPLKMSALTKLPDVTLLTPDVQDPTHIAAAVEAVQNKSGGKLDILINNSGRNHFSPVLDIDIEEAKRIFDINFWGALAVIQAFSPLVIKAQGSLVNITSISGQVNMPCERAIYGFVPSAPMLYFSFYANFSVRQVSMQHPSGRWRSSARRCDSTERHLVLVYCQSSLAWSK